MLKVFCARFDTNEEEGDDYSCVQYEGGVQCEGGVQLHEGDDAVMILEPRGLHRRVRQGKA